MSNQPGCEPAVDHTETIRLRHSGNFRAKRFLYACPEMWTVETEEDHGPVVKNVRAFKEDEKYCLFRECKDCTLHTSPKSSATYKDAHFYKLKYCTHTRQDRPVDPKNVMRRKAFLIHPQLHGNGGVCGIEVVREFRTLAQGLKSKPKLHDWQNHPCEEMDSLERPRLCLTKDYNDCLYIFNWEIGEWKEKTW